MLGHQIKQYQSTFFILWDDQGWQNRGDKDVFCEAFINTYNLYSNNEYLHTNSGNSDFTSFFNSKDTKCIGPPNSEVGSNHRYDINIFWEFHYKKSCRLPNCGSISNSFRLFTKLFKKFPDWNCNNISEASRYQC